MRPLVIGGAYPSRVLITFAQLSLRRFSHSKLGISTQLTAGSQTGAALLEGLHAARGRALRFVFDPRLPYTLVTADALNDEIRDRFIAYL